MDPGVRDQILTWLMLGDPTLMREARAKLAPPAPRPETPRTLRETLERFREDPSYPALAASDLAAALQLDFGHWMIDCAPMVTFGAEGSAHLTHLQGLPCEIGAWLSAPSVTTT